MRSGSSRGSLVSLDRLERLREELATLRRKLQVLHDQRFDPHRPRSADMRIRREIRATKIDIEFVTSQINRLTNPPPGGDAA